MQAKPSYNFCFTLALVAASGTSVFACDSGHLLVGASGDKYPDLSQYDGLYNELNAENGGVLYKHESNDLFLFSADHQGLDKYFILGADPTNPNSADVMIETTAPSPELATGVWARKSHSRSGQSWAPLTDFSVECVNSQTRTCKEDENIVLVAQNPHRALVPNLGMYEKQGTLVNDRPYYKQVGGRFYLSYAAPSIWMIGPHPGVPTGTVIVKDDARQAEHITGLWLLGTRWGFIPVTDLQVVCTV